MSTTLVQRCRKPNFLQDLELKTKGATAPIAITWRLPGLSAKIEVQIKKIKMIT
jgi:hypothetical protein